MQKTIKTPFLVNFVFISIIALGAIAFISAYEVSHASTTRSYCERQYNLSFQQKLLPVAHKKCSSEFKRITDQWTTGLYNNSK
jgi:hypothetical protein